MSTIKEGIGVVCVCSEVLTEVLRGIAEPDDTPTMGTTSVVKRGGIVAELDPKGSFSENLKELVEPVGDREVAAIIEEHTETILQVGEDSTRETRKPLVSALEDLIERRLSEELDEGSLDEDLG